MLLILITNDEAPYWKEAVNVIAQIRGARYWFRYELRNIGLAEGDLLKMRKARSEPEGLSGVVLLRSTKTGALFPIRAFTRAETERLSKITDIDFCVGNFFQNPNALDPAAFAEGPLKRLIELSRTEEGEGEGKRIKNLDKLIHLVDSRDDERAIRSLMGVHDPDKIDEEKLWFDTVSTIQNCEHMNVTCFLFLRVLLDEFDKPLPMALESRGFLAARAGTYHRARISQYCPENTILVDAAKKLQPDRDALQIPLPLELSVDVGLIRIIDGKHLLAGRFDESKMYFKTESNSAGASTVVRIVPVEVASFTGFVPTIEVDLEIHHASWQRAVLVVGVVLLFFGCLGNVAVDKTSRELWQHLKDVNAYSIMIAAGAVLTTWLGQDFWATFFRRNAKLWAGVAWFGHWWKPLVGAAAILLGASFLNYFNFPDLGEPLKSARTILKSWLADHTLVGQVLILLGFALVFWKIAKPKRTLG